MFKKIMIGTLSLCLCIGIGGVIYFKGEIKKQVNENSSLQSQNTSLQSSLDAIGQMTQVFQVPSKVYSGQSINETSLLAVSVPVSSLGDTSITNASDFKGKFYKIDIKPGTILTKDLLMDDDESIPMYTVDIPFRVLPVTTKVGDYLDIRLMLPTGEDYLVLTHKKIELINSGVVTMYLSEEELQIYNAACLDYATYGQYGVLFYSTKYLEPGKDTGVVAFYPVQHEQEDLIKYNTNIKDPTRCINSNLRDHIDYELFFAAATENSQVASSVASFFSTQHGLIATAQENWVTSVTDGTVDTIPVESGDPTLQGETGEAIESLEGSIEEVEGGIE